MDNGDNSSKMDAFLRHPLIQAVSGAFVCGVMGFAICLLFANIVYPNVAVDRVIALAAGGVCAFLGARAGFSGSKQPRDSRRSTTWAPTFIGASLIFAGALTLLGVGGNWLLACALVVGFLVATALAILP